MSPVRRIISLLLGISLTGGGAAIFGNWLFFGGGLPKYLPAVGAFMIGIGLMLLYEDIKDLLRPK